MNNPKSSKKHGILRWIGIGLVLLLVVGVVLDTLTTQEGQPQTLTIDVTSDTVSTLGPARFLYTQELNIEVCADELSNPVCIGAVERSGTWLGGIRELKPVEGCWSLKVPASQLSDSHYGPLWIIAISGAKTCAELDEVAQKTQGSGVIMSAVGTTLEAHPSWKWGAARIYVHDKIR